jgi:hypothetical protein
VKKRVVFVWEMPSHFSVHTTTSPKKIMQLPTLFSSNSIDTLYFAIHISEIAVQAVLWKITTGGPEIMSASQPHKWQDEDTCVNAIDQSLQELGKESENVKDTLFALQGSWVNAQGVVAQHKSLFQKITKELSLEAVGFVVTSEALLQHFNETMPQMSYFLIDFGLEELTLTLVKQGEVQHTQKVGRSGDTVSDFIEGFAHFEEKTFPPKMLLFSGVLSADEMHDVRQQLFEHDWTSKYPFLQQPVVDIYPADNLMEVVVHTGGRAIGEAKGIAMHSITPSPDPSLVEQFEEEKVAPVEPVEEVTGDSATPAGAEESDTLADDFTPVATPAKKITNADSDDNLMTPTSFGVPISDAHLLAEKKHSHDTDLKEEEVHHPDHERTSLKVLFFEIPHKLHLKAAVPFIIMGIVVGLLLLFVTAVFASSNLMKATVNIELKTQSISKDTSLTLDPSVASSDVNNRVLKANVISKEASGEKTAPATGAKVIGEKSKGKVTIFNRTSSTKSFSAGTEVFSGKLKYVLDSEVTVASASTGQNFETKPGTAEGNITAAAIGADSNLDNNTDLTIANFGKETYVARTSSEVTGGSSREILAVSTQDRDKLLADLKKELTDQALEQFKSEAGDGSYVVPTGAVKIIERKYSADVGKEANSFSLQLKVQVDALTYQVSELKPVVLELLKGDIPAGYQLSNQDPQILSSPAKGATGSSKISLDANVTAIALPVVDPEAWKQEVAGKSDQEATQIFEQKPEIESVQITLLPSVLTFISHSLPQPKNIIIKIMNGN